MLCLQYLRKKKKKKFKYPLLIAKICLFLLIPAASNNIITIDIKGAFTSLLPQQKQFHFHIIRLIRKYNNVY